MFRKPLRFEALLTVAQEAKSASAGKLSGVALSLLSNGQQAMDRQLQRMLTEGSSAKMQLLHTELA